MRPALPFSAASLCARNRRQGERISAALDYLALGYAPDASTRHSTPSPEVRRGSGPRQRCRCSGRGEHRCAHLHGREAAQCYRASAAPDAAGRGVAAPRALRPPAKPGASLRAVAQRAARTQRARASYSIGPFSGYLHGTFIMAPPRSARGAKRYWPIWRCPWPRAVSRAPLLTACRMAYLGPRSTSPVHLMVRRCATILTAATRVDRRPPAARRTARS